MTLSIGNLLVIYFITASSQGIHLPARCFQSIVITRDNCSLSLVPDFLPSIDLPSALFGTKCCSDNTTGCFENELGSKYECFPTLPDCPLEMGVEFKLYSPDLPDVQSITYANLKDSVDALIMDTSRPLVLATHGLGSDWPKWWTRPLLDAFRKLVRSI